MAAKRSKSKGSAFERQVAMDLSKWIPSDIDKNTGKHAYWVYRSPNSGALATTTATVQYGDLIAINGGASFIVEYFSIECKTGYPAAIFTTLLKNNKTHDIVKFWEQCTRDANLAGNLPLLIYKHSATRWVGVCDTFLNEYKTLGECLTDKITSIKYKCPSNGDNITFFEYKAFFETVTSDNIKSLNTQFTNNR